MIMNTIRPYLKAVVAGVLGTVLPLIIVGLTTTFDWKAILAAAVTGAASALGVYRIPNKPNVVTVKPSINVQRRERHDW